MNRRFWFVAAHIRGGVARDSVRSTEDSSDEEADHNEDHRQCDDEIVDVSGCACEPTLERDFGVGAQEAAQVCRASGEQEEDSDAYEERSGD